MKIITLTLLYTSLIIANASSVNSATFIGRENPPLPADCKHLQSMVLGASDTFAFELLKCNDQNIVILQRFIERRGKAAYWKIVDELILPKVAQEQEILGVPSCKSTSYKEEPIIAIGKWIKTSESTYVAKDISYALRFNLPKGKIESISTRGVSCEGEYLD